MPKRPWLAFACAVTALAVSAAAPASRPDRQIAKPRWLEGVQITQYYPVPEAWFRGKLVLAPGLTGVHRVDWLYSGRGVSMEGDGIGLDGRRYHIASTGDQGWVDEAGKPTIPGAGGWTRGFPFWRAVGWRNTRGEVTFPLADGTWHRGKPKRYIEPKGTFGLGPSRELDYWRSVAVDTTLIPLGSRLFVPALCQTPGRGWVTAADTGSAIIGRHIDLYRPAPSSLDTHVDVWENATMYVLPLGAKLPKLIPVCRGTDGDYVLVPSRG
jgi:3D (Asp-Asp-Asp) domain-containing protein